jgi:NAD(P)-dependent dehydrogenase (short-subunit alcohol dehydrogenase family)
MSLAGRRFVVTGGSSGLGAHIVRGLARDGASILAVARRLDRLERLVEDLAELPGRVVACRADVTSPEDCGSAMAAAVETLGGIDVLVNDAGGEGKHPNVCAGVAG